MIIFVTGGARSGKSSFAERRALKLGGAAVTYLATAEALDDEMAGRIARHRADRPAGWTTLEVPQDVAPAIREATTPVVLLDCLSLLVSNLMLGGLDDEAVLFEVDATLNAAEHRTLLIVTNEVGWGIVPENALARRYRDLLGWANQRAAARSDEAWLLASGLPLKLK